ncbi:MAG: HDOD domain-containing protein [Gammaproteobacteria bacterium]|nr:MAG: HDOD domain-containing protein [Gammaproteobacteria bacterium]
MNQTTAVVQTLLGQLWPVRDLDQSQQIKLLKKSRMDNYAGGKRLNASEEQNWLVYLLDGKVNLLTERGVEPLSTPSARTQQPLFSGKNLREAAIVQGHARILRVDRRYLEILSEQQTEEGIEVSDVQITEDENRLFQDIYTAFSQGGLELPNLPVAGQVAHTLLEREDLDTESVAGLMMLDPGLLGSLLQTANTPTYRGEAGKVHSVLDAMERIGLEDLHDLVEGMAQQNPCTPQHPETLERMEREWQRSLTIGAMCHTLAQQFPELDPERARLAGLMHRIGALAILQQLDQADELASLATSDHAIETLQALVGVLVVTGLDMEGRCSSIIEQSREWLRDTDDEAPVDYIDLLLVAQLLHDMEDGLPEGLPPVDELPVYRKLDPGAHSENLRPLLMLDAEEDLERFRRLLEGEALQEEAPALNPEIELELPPRKRPKSRPTTLLKDLLRPKPEKPAAEQKPPEQAAEPDLSTREINEAAYRARLAELGLSEDGSSD